MAPEILKLLIYKDFTMPRASSYSNEMLMTIRIAYSIYSYDVQMAGENWESVFISYQVYFREGLAFRQRLGRHSSFCHRSGSHFCCEAFPLSHSRQVRVFIRTAPGTIAEV